MNKIKQWLTSSIFLLILMSICSANSDYLETGWSLEGKNQIVLFQHDDTKLGKLNFSWLGQIAFAPQNKSCVAGLGTHFQIAKQFTKVLATVNVGPSKLTGEQKISHIGFTLLTFPQLGPVKLNSLNQIAIPTQTESTTSFFFREILTIHGLGLRVWGFGGPSLKDISWFIGPNLNLPEKSWKIHSCKFSPNIKFFLGWDVTNSRHQLGGGIDLTLLLGY